MATTTKKIRRRGKLSLAVCCAKLSIFFQEKKISHNLLPKPHTHTHIHREKDMSTHFYTFKTYEDRILNWPDEDVYMSQ